MILQFSVSNYRCFRGLQTLSLAASTQDKSLPENSIATEHLGERAKRWTKGVALYGANASGKTTLLEALKTLAALVQNSAKVTDPKEQIPEIEPFALGDQEKAEPTAFDLMFVVDDIRYEYRVAVSKVRVWHESLRAFPSKKEQIWFERTWNSESNAYSWKPDRPSGFSRDSQLEAYTLSNMLFLSKAIASNRSELEPVFRWFKEQLIFINLSAGVGFGHSTTLQHVKDQTLLYPQIVALLHHADLGITGAKAIEYQLTFDPAVEKVVGSFPKDILERLRAAVHSRPELTHRGRGSSEMPLPWESESAGTKRFFSLLGPWLDILRLGRVVCVDELENSIHPLMVRELLRLFFSASENPKGAQILFTTHSPFLLDASLLRRDQIWFTEKDFEGASHLYPLTDYSPRKGESLVRGYLSGRYGGVPFLPHGLVSAFETKENTSEPMEKPHE